MSDDSVFEKYMTTRNRVYDRFIRVFGYVSAGLLIIFGIIFSILLLSLVPIIFIIIGVLIAACLFFWFKKVHKILVPEKEKEYYMHDGGFLFISFAQYLIEEKELLEHETKIS